MKQIFTFLIATLVFQFSNAQAPTPFTCSSVLYQSLQNDPGAGAKLVKITSYTGTTVPVGAAQTNYTYNGIGYNVLDNFIYGALNSNSNHIVRIGANGAVADLGAALNLPVKSYNAGDVDNSGILYIKPGGSNDEIYRIVVLPVPGIPVVPIATKITLDKSISISDIAIDFANPTGLFAYAVQDAVTAAPGPEVYKINLVTGVVTIVGKMNMDFPAATIAPGGPYFGGQFIDNNDKFYVFENGDPKLSGGTPSPGRFFEINKTTGAATLVSSAFPASSKNDGAFCRNASIATLPVKLGKFEASRSGADVKIDWNTYTETNNSHFEIEVSDDAVTFNNIGTVQGAGNSTSEKHYSYTHLSAAKPGKNALYYRLKQVDIDGRYIYSSIVKVSFSQNATQLEISPVPARQGTKIMVQGYTVRNYKLYSMVGTPIAEGAANAADKMEIEISKLPSGTYIIKFADGKTGRFVIL